MNIETKIVVILILTIVLVGVMYKRKNTVSEQSLESEESMLDDAIAEIKMDIRANVKSYFKTRTNIVRTDKEELFAFCNKYGLVTHPEISKKEMTEILIGYLVD